MQDTSVIQAVNILNQNIWFRDLPLETLKAFAHAGRLHRFNDGELLANRGSPPPGVAIIISGGVCSSSCSQDGHEVAYSLLKAGTLWGLVAIMDGYGTIHETRAHGETNVLLIPRAAFLKILDQSPFLYRHFTRVLCYRLRKAYGIVEEFALMRLRPRLVRQLCAIGVSQHRESGAYDLMHITVTQDELAALLGVSRPAVNRELKQLERENLITVHYGKIVLNNFGELRGLCAHQKILPF